MVENKTRKIERDEIIVCGVCNNAIPKDYLENSLGGIKNFYCQYCGVPLNLTSDPINNNVSGKGLIISPKSQKESKLTNFDENNQENDFTLSYSNIRNALRDYMFQLIYQLLKSTPLTLKRIQNKKELKSSHINVILKKLWNELKDLNLNDLANQELVSSKRRIRNYFEKFQLALRPYKQFRKNNFTLFAENIEFVFGLILGDYAFSNLTTSKKRIVLDLKKSFGFKSDTKTTNSFTYNISLIVSKKIRSILNQYHITEGNDNKLALDEIIGHVIDYIVNRKVNLSDLSKINSPNKKRFHKTLEVLIDNLKTDWIYRISFEDHIYKLIIIVDSLMRDADYSSNLIGFERLISQGLTQSALFEKDQEFSPHFKLNLTLILCRIIYLKIKNSPDITKLNSQPVNLSITDEIEVKNSILEEITASKKINSKLLKKFYKFSLEEFQTYYEKLQKKLDSDLIYVENFCNYLSDLVRLVFSIVHSISKKSQLTKLELAVIKDLANYNFEWFNKKPERSYFYYLNLTNQSNKDKKSISLTLNDKHLENAPLEEKLEQKQVEKNSSLERRDLKERLKKLLNSKKNEILAGIFIPTPKNIAEIDKGFDLGDNWKKKAKYLYNVLRWWIQKNTDFNNVTELKEHYLGTPQVRDIANEVNIFLNHKKSEILNGEFIPTLKNIKIVDKKFERLNKITRISYLILRWLKNNTPFKSLRELQEYHNMTPENEQIKAFLNSKKQEILKGEFLPYRENFITLDNRYAKFGRFDQIVNYWIKLETPYKNITELKEKLCGKDIGKRIKEYLESRKADILSGKFIPTKYNLRKINPDFANYYNSDRSVTQWLTKNSNFKSIRDLIKHFLYELSYQELGYTSKYTLKFNEEAYRVKNAWFQVVKKIDNNRLIQIDHRKSPKTWEGLFSFLNKNNQWKYVDLLTGEILEMDDRMAFHHINGDKLDDDFFNLIFSLQANHAIITAAQHNWKELSEFLEDILISNLYSILEGQIPESWKVGWRKMAVEKGFKLPKSQYTRKKEFKQKFAEIKPEYVDISEWLDRK